MIARLWHGKVPTEKAASYHDFLIGSGLKDFAETKGNKGYLLLKKEDEGNLTHFYTLSLWEDLDSIKQFAGEDVLKARYYPEDADYLLEFETFVNHMDVLEASGIGRPASP